jgi:cytochrome c biogenesis factor
MGGVVLAVGLIGCLVVLLPYGHMTVSQRLNERQIRHLTTIGLLLSWLPFLFLVQRFIVDDTSIAAVNASGGASMPLLYRVAATWSARSGPLLLWAGCTATLAWWWRAPMEGESSEVAARRVGLLGGFAAVLMLLAIHLRPFVPTLPGALRGELNPLLQTDLMVVHPPLVFCAYAFCLSIAATGISSIGQTDQGLLNRVVQQARPGFFVATLAIGLGGLWAYLILDWGGYWAWDPVETGSFLPWLALALLAHLRTVPRKVPGVVIRGSAILTGALALFATLVTRAGGAWAASVHTFVVASEGSAPNDAFGRIVALAVDGNAGVEVMTYLLVLLLFAGWWLVDVSLSSGSEARPRWIVVDLSIPALIGVVVLLEWSTTIAPGVLGWIIPVGWAWGLVVVFPTLLLVGWPRWKEDGRHGFARPRGWPLDWLLALGIAAAGGDVLLAIVWLCLFSPIAMSESPEQHVPAATFGVALALISAWTDLVPMHVAAMMLLPFLAPWVSGEDTSSPVASIPSVLKHAPLWAGAGMAGLMLVFTLVILLGSIDQIHFAAHEVYGSILLASTSGALLLYTLRHRSVAVRLTVLSGLVLISLVGAVVAPGRWGGDPQEGLSNVVQRGHIAWVIAPTAIVAVPHVVNEVVRAARTSSNTPWWRRVPVHAHLVHVGLLLLIFGHVMTTTLVDRGDPVHRITMLKDEPIDVDGWTYTFREVKLIPGDELVVGDGAVHVVIDVYDGSNFRGTAEPGMTRFDASGFPRSEVDVVRGPTGDVVLIFDFTQAGDLMQTVAMDGEDAVDAVRVTVYRLPQSHAVWLGWGLMLLGMAGLSISGRRKTGHLPAA